MLPRRPATEENFDHPRDRYPPQVCAGPCRSAT